jgi:hypothetical protein
MLFSDFSPFLATWNLKSSNLLTYLTYLAWHYIGVGANSMMEYGEMHETVKFDVRYLRSCYPSVGLL